MVTFIDCMCLAFPGKIIQIQGHKAKIKYTEETRDALIGDEHVQVGDICLVQMGIIIKVLKPQEIKALAITLPDNP